MSYTASPETVQRLNENAISELNLILLALHKKAKVNPPESMAFYELSPALSELAEKFNLVKCDSCGNYYDTDSLEVTYDFSNNDSEVTCRSCK